MIATSFFLALLVAQTELVPKNVPACGAPSAAEVIMTDKSSNESLLIGRTEKEVLSIKGDPMKKSKGEWTYSLGFIDDPKQAYERIQHLYFKNGKVSHVKTTKKQVACVYKE